MDYKDIIIGNLYRGEAGEIIYVIDKEPEDGMSKWPIEGHFAMINADGKTYEYYYFGSWSPIHIIEEVKDFVWKPCKQL